VPQTITFLGYEIKIIMKLPGKINLLVLILIFPIVLCAEEQNVRPGINQYYMDPDFERWQSIFESEGREVYDRRIAILNTLNLKAGHSIADIGAGTGLFSLLFSNAVGPNGKVYAVDISQEFVKNIQRRARENNLDNLIGVVNDQKNTKLAKDSIDIAFICDTYHHFEYPQSTMQSIHQALRPGGQVIIIDFRKQAGFSSSWVMGHVRANKETVIKEIEAQGFKFIEDKKILHSNYYLRFKK